MTPAVPWGPLAGLGGALIVGLLYRRFAPQSAQGPASPVWWLFVLLVVAVFGELAVALARS